MDLLSLKLADRAFKIFKQIVINFKDKIDRGVLAFVKRSGEFEEGLGDLKKILNLAPFVLAKCEVSKLELRTKFVECRL